METIIYLTGVTIGLLLSIPLVIAFIVSFVLEGVVFTKLAKERPVKNLWFVWVPYVEYVGKKYIMAQMSNETEFRLFGGKLVFKNKLTPIWIYLAIYAVNMLMSLVTLLLGWIPIIGLIILLLDLIILIPATVVLYFIEFVYFRDLLNEFKPNQSNVSTAIWITVTNPLAFGLVRAIYLFGLMKSQNKNDCAK